MSYKTVVKNYSSIKSLVTSTGKLLHIGILTLVGPAGVAGSTLL